MCFSPLSTSHPESLGYGLYKPLFCLSQPFLLSSTTSTQHQAN